MILIADSGSTKTDWRLIDKNRVAHQYYTVGFNPYFQDSEAIAAALSKELLPAVQRTFQELRNRDLLICFYGAGCSTPEKCRIVEEALRSVFPGAVIEVEHDLLAAARALFGRQQGIAAILGTGSNSCYYDGEKIKENVASLGFILGDEGSGAYIGKMFLRDYLYNEVPAEVRKRFDDTYKLGRETILDGIYKGAMPSRFLASFSRFIYLNRDTEYFSSLVSSCFEHFFDRHICKYPRHREVSLSCVGSVGYYYSSALIKVAESRGVAVDKVIDSPMPGLLNYHLHK